MSMHQAAAKLGITASTLYRCMAACRCCWSRTRTGWPELTEDLLAIVHASSRWTLQQALAEDVST